MVRTLIVLLFIQLFILIGCKPKLGDPLHGLIIGSNEKVWKNKVDSNIINSIFKESSSDCHYDTYMIIGEDTIEVSVGINDYSLCFGKMLKYKIYIDYEMIHDTIRGRVLRRYSYPIKEIYKSFIDLYGSPTYTKRIPEHMRSLYHFRYEYRLFYPHMHALETENIPEDSIDHIDWFVSFWEFPNQIIEFLVGEEYTLYDSIPRISRSQITYLYRDYQKELETLKDSVINSYEPNDYLELTFSMPEITRKGSYEGLDRTVVFYLKSLKRAKDVDYRTISSIKFDILMLDSFGEEIFRSEDNSESFIRGIEGNKIYNYTTYNNKGIGYTFTYDSNHPDAQKLERFLRGGYSPCIDWEITAIKFSDGLIIYQ
ncbi:MAG: hypothetical protein JW965_00005 [Bacteroidales bacterium]|nr:hypothetical protein [Bacteroidales bacterium]